jgi:hypothetical protein
VFNKPTVFVVGAGASAECALPTGASLKEQIANGVRFRFDYSDLKSGEVGLLRALKRQFSNDQKQVDSFTAAGNELSETISTFPSIDEALHWWKARQEIVQLGKIAIAFYILEAERRSSLALKPESGRVNVDNVSETWLQSFLSIAIATLERKSVASAFDNVTIVNFNYDRTIEQYLYWALQQRAGVVEQDARLAVSRLKIIRPYGSIGNLEWGENPAVRFGANEQDSNIFSVSKNIRTFTEQTDHSTVQQAIDDAMETAHVVVFLGFGFHQQNLALLSPGVGKSRSSVRTILATVFEVDERNYPAIQERLYNSLALRPQALLAPLKCGQLLTNLRLSVSMAAA